MSKTTSLLGALGAFGALAYLMAPLPPETASLHIGSGTTATGVILNEPARQQAQAALVRLATTNVKPASNAPQDPTVLLVRQLQTELLRLGCYDGAIDGQWTAETRDAMQTLGERVRVLRPVDTPDYIMLALARSQESHVCVPRGSATASRQPARLVPMAGLITNTHINTAERSRRSAPLAQAPEIPKATSGRVARAQRPAASPGNQAATELTAARAPHDEPRAGGVAVADRASLEQNRMSLGAAAIDPLRAGSDPRNPTAPAVLRGPSPARAAPDRPAVEEIAPRVRRARSHAARAPRPAAPRGTQRAWARTFFSEMQRKGH